MENPSVNPYKDIVDKYFQENEKAVKEFDSNQNIKKVAIKILTYDPKVKEGKETKRPLEELRGIISVSRKQNFISRFFFKHFPSVYLSSFSPFSAKKEIIAGVEIEFEKLKIRETIKEKLGADNHHLVKNILKIDRNQNTKDKVVYKVKVQAGKATADIEIEIKDNKITKDSIAKLEDTSSMLIEKEKEKNPIKTEGPPPKTEDKPPKTEVPPPKTENLTQKPNYPLDLKITMTKKEGGDKNADFDMRKIKDIFPILLSNLEGLGYSINYEIIKDSISIEEIENRTYTLIYKPKESTENIELELNVEKIKSDGLNKNIIENFLNKIPDLLGKLDKKVE